MKNVITALEKAGIEYLVNEPMNCHTSFKIGGAADLFVRPENAGEIICALEIAHENKIPVTVVGNGSNLLVSDKGIEGMVICPDKLSNVEINGCEIYAQAGVILGKVASEAAQNSLTGMEFAAGIPGSIGGAVYMNAGAYGGEMKDIVKYVNAVRIKDRTSIRVEASECDFGYRHSFFSSGEYVITDVALILTSGKKEEILAVMKDLAGRRRDKQPLEYPSAGSTFKRPEGYFAGALIEQAGLKGCSVGGAQVSEKHAGFVINKSGATCEDVMNLINHVKDEVLKTTGVLLEEEVRITGRK